MPSRADLMEYIEAGGEPDGYLWPDPAWSPAFWTQMESTRTLGDDIIEFIETYVPPKNIRASVKKRGWKLEEWQKFKLRNQFELNEYGFLRYREYYFSVAKQNGKSWMETGIQLYFLTKSADVMGYRAFNFASSRRQAKEIFDHASKIANENDVLSEVIKVYKDRFLENTYTGGTLIPLSNNFKAAQGPSPVYTTADEIWSMFNLTGESDAWELNYEGLVQSSANRDESQVSMATTAGTNLNAFAYQKYTYGKELSLDLTTPNQTYGAMVWEADEDGDISDRQQWIYANPNLAPGVDIMAMTDMEAAYAKAEAFGSYNFETFRLNKWLRHGKAEGFIMESFLEEWRDRQGDIALGEPVCLGFDGSTVKDSTVIVAISLKTGFMKILKIWEKPAREPNWRVKVNEVEAEMDLIFKQYDVKYLYGDPSKYVDSFEKWIKKFGKIVRDEPPTISRFTPYATRFREALYEGKLTWNDDKLKEHFLNAVTNWREIPIRSNRKDNKYKDALDASIYAWAGVYEYVTKRERMISKYGSSVAARDFGYNFSLPEKWNKNA